MSEHTKGPRQLDGGDCGDPSVGMAGYAPYIFVDCPTRDGDEVLIATLHEPTYDCDEQGGVLSVGDIGKNAALIKSAPDLLEQLRAMTAIVFMVANQPGVDMAQRLKLEDLAEGAFRVIRRADGSSQATPKDED